MTKSWVPIDCRFRKLLCVLFKILVFLRRVCKLFAFFTAKVGNNPDAMTRKRKQGKRYHGLKNQGATCYLNSVLQVLYMTKDFRQAVLNSSQQNHGCIDHRLRSLFHTLTSNTASTQEITNHLGIKKVNEQHDAAECFDKILSCSSLKASEIFKGELTHKTTCSKCEIETETKSPFWSLPLTLSETEYYRVTEGIKSFFQESEVGGENQLYCCECQEKRDSSTRLEMHHHPDVLTLLLKRFKFDYHHMDYVKIKCKVQIPETLRIPTTKDEIQNYQLYACVDHSGELRSGHYTATIKPPDDDKWHIFNDVTAIESFQPFQVDEEHTSSTAYLLFYRRIAGPLNADSSGASTSGCSQSNEPCREGGEATGRQEGEKATEHAVREKTNKNRESKKTKRVKDEQSEATETADDHIMSTTNKSPEYENPLEIRYSDNINNNRMADSDGQSRDKLQEASENKKVPGQKRKTVQNERRTENKQVVNHGRKGKKHKEECEDLDTKDVCGNQRENCPTGLCDEQKDRERRDQKGHEETQGGVNLESFWSETGGKDHSLHLANGNENGQKQAVMQKEQHCCNKHNEVQDTARIDGLKSQHNLRYPTLKEKYNVLSVEKDGNEEIIKILAVKKHNKHQKSQTCEEESKIENSDRIRQSISASSHEGPDGKEEDPKTDKCSTLKEKSQSFAVESEESQKTVDQDKDGQNKLQGDAQQTMDPVAEEMEVKLESNTHNEAKASDSQKESLKQQNDETIQTGNENVNENKSLTESNPEKMMQVSPAAEMLHEGENRCGKNKNKKGQNKKPNVVVSVGLVYRR